MLQKFKKKITTKMLVVTLNQAEVQVGLQRMNAYVACRNGNVRARRARTTQSE